MPRRLREIAHEHGVLEPALHAVAAADVDVVVHAHRVAGKPQRARELVGEFRHLDRSPDVEDLLSRVPLRGDAEGLDRHRGAAPPLRAQGELVFRARERVIHGAPDEALVQDDVGAVRRMHERAAVLDRLLGIDDVRGRLVFDFDQLDRVLGDGARIGDHGGHPFAGVAHDAARERIARHLRRIDADLERVAGVAEFFAGQHVVHARQRQRGSGVDRNDACAGVG